jgi:hypothetical protein
MEEKIFINKSGKPIDRNIKPGLGKPYLYYTKINDLVINFVERWLRG